MTEVELLQARQSAYSNYATTPSQGGGGRRILKLFRYRSSEKRAAMEGATQKEIAQRLKSIEGHIRGIQRMVDAERP